MKDQETKLLQQAAQLFALGLQVELARKKLQNLVEQGVSYDAAEMRIAFNQFQLLEQSWKLLEESHLKLRNKVHNNTYPTAYLPLPCLPNLLENLEQNKPIG